MVFAPYFLNLNRPGAIRSYADFLHQTAGNTGNSYIGETVLKHLWPDQPVRGVNNMFADPLDDAALEEAKASSHIILTVQDQLREKISYFDHPPWEKIGSFIAKAQKPVVVFSLGANALNGPWEVSRIDPALVHTLRIIASQSVTLGIRCHFTEEALASLGIHNVSVIGCPTYFFMGKDRKVKKRRRLEPSDKIIFNGSFSDLGAVNFDYVLQDESFFLRLLLEPQTLTKDDAVSIKDLNPFYRRQMLEGLMAGKVASHFSFRQAIQHYRTAAFSIGTRLHGSIASLNAGTPAVLTSGDLRARGTAEFFGIPWRPELGGPSSPPLKEVYREIDLGKINSAYNRLYKNYKAFYVKNGLPYFGDKTKPESDLQKPAPASFGMNAQARQKLQEIMPDFIV